MQNNGRRETMGGGELSTFPGFQFSDSIEHSSPSAVTLLPSSYHDHCPISSIS